MSENWEYKEIDLDVVKLYLQKFELMDRDERYLMLRVISELYLPKHVARK